MYFKIGFKTLVVVKTDNICLLWLCFCCCKAIRFQGQISHSLIQREVTHLYFVRSGLTSIYPWDPQCLFPTSPVLLISCCSWRFTIARPVQNVDHPHPGKLLAIRINKQIKQVAVIKWGVWPDRHIEAQLTYRWPVPFIMPLSISSCCSSSMHSECLSFPIFALLLNILWVWHTATIPSACSLL